MATIFYSMSGEGRGHATRVRAIVDDLRRRHRVFLFAPGQAYSLLAPLYENSDVEVRPIDGLSFRYRADGRLDYIRSAKDALFALGRFPGAIGALRAEMRLECPDLAITDFEPLLPRAAEMEGVPYISIDHQHFLTEFSDRDLPPVARAKASLMGLAVRMFHWRQKLTVVSSFYKPPLRAGRRGKRVRQVGVLLGKDVVGATPSDNGFLLVYLRRDTPENVFRALAECGVPARIYGPEKIGTEGNLEYLPVDRRSFVDDLSRCRALVSTAGNQVVGEAMHLRKPVLALPESGNWEQAINGFWVDRMGIGRCVPSTRLEADDIHLFLERLDAYKSSMRPVAGNDDVSRIVEEFIRGLPLDRRSPWPHPPMRRQALREVA